jgi:hypothetical protein
LEVASWVYGDVWTRLERHSLKIKRSSSWSENTI